MIKAFFAILLLTSCSLCHAFEKEWRAVKQYKKHFKPVFYVPASVNYKDYNPVFRLKIHSMYVKPIKPELISLK